MAKKHTMAIGFGLALVAGVALTVRAADDKAPFNDIKKLADQVGKKSWDELTKESQAIAKKHELLDIMEGYKLRSSPKTPGIGIGATPGAIVPDGIEAKIINLQRKAMVPSDLEKEQKDLIRMAEISAAISGIATHQCPEDKKKQAKEWAKLTKDAYDASQELIKALKDKKPADVKAAAFKLYGTCTECHSEIRDK